MYNKLSVPIHFRTVNSDSLTEYLEILNKIKADRIFICGMGEIVDENSEIYRNYEKLKDTVGFFKDNGFETGIWIGALGHGKVLSHQMENEAGSFRFTPITGADGSAGAYSYCPCDENFVSEYVRAVKKIATLKPELIQLDDDFRFISRPTYRIGCFCEKHLEGFCKRTGEQIPRDKIEGMIYSGGRNKYRTEYLKLMSESLIEFAKKIRAAVDEIDPDIRLSACCVDEMWSFDKEHPLKLLKAFAGKTKPFLRTTGAPYHNGGTVIESAEITRVQFEWLKNSGVEVFAEGDVYPRPRYNVPSKLLELFEYILIANGEGSGGLNYMFDYIHSPGYETGYTDRYIKNEKHRNAIRRIFEGKTVTGIRTFNVPSKIENWNIPEETYGENLYAYLNKRNTESPSHYHLSYNSIPTTFGESGYPVFLAGENARYISETELSNGAIIDVTAAEILNERGIDTGLVTSENAVFSGEYYIDERDTVINIGSRAMKKIVCNENAEVMSLFIPDNTPASYIYENKKGQRFYLLANDACFLNSATFHSENLRCPDYLVNYHRQRHMIKAAEWLCGKRLPVVCTKNPRLYILAAVDDSSMSVLMVNVFPDDVITPEIILDREYREAEFVNCSGELNGDRVKFNVDIAPYGFAAFNVRI